MTAAMYLEHYLDSLESLPKEIQKNFGQMRDLDTQSVELNKEIDRLADEYLSRVRDLASDRKKEHLNNIQNLFNKSKKFGDEKVQLALQTYELVDRHIRRLDADLARFELDIKEQPMSPLKVASNNKLGSSASKSGSKMKDVKGKKRREKDASDCEVAKKKKKNKTEEPSGVSSSVPLALSLLPLGGSSHSSDVLDMPVDPNEPTYCTCHQVSYGEMIGCDNPDCPIEWFHFGCVGLTTKPKGKWFCSRCSVERKKKL